MRLPLLLLFSTAAGAADRLPPPPCDDGPCLLCLLGAEVGEPQVDRYIEAQGLVRGHASWALLNEATGASMTLDADDGRTVSSLDWTEPPPGLVELFGRPASFAALSAADPVAFPPQKWRAKGIVDGDAEDVEIEGRRYTLWTHYLPIPRVEGVKDYRRASRFEVRTWEAPPPSCDAWRFGPEIPAVVLDVAGWQKGSEALAALEDDGWRVLESGGQPPESSDLSEIHRLPAHQDLLALVDAPGARVGAELWLRKKSESMGKWPAQPDVWETGDGPLPTTGATYAVHLDQPVEAGLWVRVPDDTPVFWALLVRPGRGVKRTASAVGVRHLDPAPTEPEDSGPTALDRYQAFKRFTAQTDSERAEVRRQQQAERAARLEAYLETTRVYEDPGLETLTARASLLGSHGGPVGTLCVVIRANPDTDRAMLAERAEAAFQAGSVVQGQLDWGRSGWTSFGRSDTTESCDAVVR